jgi:ribosomal protein S18 acetylase RimI-like enzyme
VSWKIFQKLFNLPPWDGAEYFTDKLGKKFWFAWGTHFNFGPKLWVYYRGKWVGTVESAWNDEGGLDLCDIVIFEDDEYLHGRGIGQKMLDLFIDKAQEEGAKFIWGFISPHDGSTVEELLQWYERQGFSVYEAKPNKFQLLMKRKVNYGD